MAPTLQYVVRKKEAIGYRRDQKVFARPIKTGDRYTLLRLAVSRESGPYEIAVKETPDQILSLKSTAA